MNGGETHPCHHADSRTPSREGTFIAFKALKNLLYSFIATALAIFLFSSCKPENLKKGAVKEYFDIKGYFESSIAQLKKRHNRVSKTVVHNGTSESKVVEISNWDTELALFTEADINKPAWKRSYAKQDSAGTTIYTAKEPGLKTRRIVISKTKQGIIKQIAIYNEVNNVLYNTRETLNYFPDSAYSIDKYQKVRLLGANSYKITGRF